MEENLEDTGGATMVFKLHNMKVLGKISSIEWTNNNNSWTDEKIKVCLDCLRDAEDKINLNFGTFLSRRKQDWTSLQHDVQKSLPIKNYTRILSGRFRKTDRNEKLSGPVNRMSFLSRFRCRKLREINLRWRQSNHEGRIGWFRFTKEIDLCIISLMVLCFPLNAARTQMTQRKHVQHKEVVKGLTSEGHQKAGELRRTHDCWYRRCQRGWKSF